MAETKENKEKEKSRRDALSKFFYNLAQTCFTAMVVGTIVTFFVSNVTKAAFLNSSQWVSSLLLLLHI